jgi:xylan 1,4-beta-xylosidase
MGGKNYFSRCNAFYREKMRRLKQPPLEIFITEFNLSAKHGNYLLDTMFAACFALYNYLQNRDQLNGIAYWTLSDIFEEDSQTCPPFGGGFGLVTREGIKKSSWWALWFLERLKGALAAGNIGSDDDVQYCVTRDEGSAAVLAFNYVFYDKLFIKGDSSLLTYEERYNCFEQKSAAPFAVELRGLTGTWELREYTLDREHGSAFDLFVKMGMPQTLSREDAAYLRAMSRPALEIKRLALNGKFNARFVLPPHGVKLLLLKKIYG